MKKSHFIGTLCASFCLLNICMSPVHAVPVSGQGTWETTLQGRDLDGNAANFEAYYDTALDITWLADANFAQTSGFDADGRMPWDNMVSWVLGLDINGITGWQMPNVFPINRGAFSPWDGGSSNISFSNNASTDWGYADSAGWVDGSGNPVSAMGHMYYTTLGNLGFCTPDNVDPSGCVEQTGWGPTNTGPFSNIQSAYWVSGALVPPGMNNLEWDFRFNWGRQSALDKNNFLSTWVVHTGDVGTVVPAPATVWLFVSGLGLLGWMRRKAT